ncbi:hypothetical protein FVB32_16405 [Flagellimonas hymeniacidonis]|uniref:Fibronectin type-III domain-containing protein n=1 Tax=Flagellimonas hymeniacidonis TaxID=2603628 RepID=A0A5C8V4Z2_9FLAO|nr:LamG-like jellyroll fold domain-containing protein [Flagellimonas hymeniacidonis]TXN36139.1 hypothetical protein FVB32_16405 [Flagellimonas hymeniacidonis]
MRVILIIVLAMPMMVFAQNPTSLVPQSARIPELVTWIDAEEQTGADGSQVTSVIDQAGVLSGIVVEGTVTLNITGDGKKEFGFSGSNSAINLGKPASLNFIPGTDEFTIMSTFGENNGTQGFLVAKASSGSNSSYGMARLSGSPGSYSSTIGSTIETFAQQSMFDEDEVWTLVVTTTQQSLYVNGLLQSSDNIGTSTVDLDVLIGARRDASNNTGTGFEFDGTIKNIGFFNKALSSSEIQAIYNDLTNPSGDTQPPTAPTLASTGQSETTADLSWSGATDNIGVTGYKIFKDGALEATLGNVSAHQVTGLTADTAYNFTATALDGAGNESAVSNTVPITTNSSGGGSSGGSVWSEANSVASYTGDVAVGTNSVPNGYKMAIDGKLITEEVKVQLSGNWPDYVFAKDYDLPSLEEIQKHIKEKGHLPNIPSAKEVEQNGFELGEMNRLLIEKIEELTLYILQLEQKNQTIEKRLNKIENK